jgi:glycerophosphoryl diester phosphodiesterase
MPENTMAAIESAIELCVDMVEIDIRLDRDGVPALMHNNRVDFTTSGTGLVAELTLDELGTLDAGSWRGPEFAGETVLGLEEVLDLTRDRMALNLDIKVPEAARPTALAVAKAGVPASVVISGCTPSSVRTIGDTARDIATLLNLDELLAGIEPAAAPAAAHRSIGTAVELGAIAINVPHPLVTIDLVEQAHDAGIGVSAFTVDDEALFVDLLGTGVDSLTTNWPERMLPLATDRISRLETNRS